MNVLLKDVSLDSIIYLRKLIHRERVDLLQQLRCSDDDSEKTGISCEIDLLNQISFNL